ncbi:hypothetical protein ECDEC14D_0543 [Escherichia coli DEC14D]|nr:hypothetical protein ECDEC14D_0543 [Escherichia coli DEC14D]
MFAPVLAVPLTLTLSPKGARGRIVRFVEFVITPLTLLITGS